MPTHTVTIDGELYVKATDAVAEVDDILQALYVSYMGGGRDWKSDSTALWIAVNEDGDGMSFQEFAEQIAQVKNYRA